MSKRLGASSISALLLFAFPPAQAVPLYLSADFSGSVTNTPHFSTELELQRTKDKDCNGCPQGTVSGHVLFDASLAPAAHSGIVNIPLASIMDASDNFIFSISLGSGPLAFHFGSANIGEEPAIQFKHGVFNGFNFSETFFLDGNSFRFDIDGSNWDIKVANKNGVYSKLAASGLLDVGSSGLLNQQVFEPISTPPAELPIDAEFPSTPPAELPANVPEPATLPLLGLGLAAMVFLNKKLRIRKAC
ncbi:PEP-CTERM protein-sorting domain-containing protein [Nitrosospira multiformis]|uniref:PEP-CTERM protein-sorting domain-containing protein n=1 Tax=Nitrosospira multiformis TaxID=1231 RepID=A0A1H8N3K8_9PROT|nr:PEP-CTERM sorting domain-containing protein [Nitrosospira multiformis]SEO24150.1 PEP-CTERM protein-sorting domain-containing protein [Nitrosospira multiformis]